MNTIIFQTKEHEDFFFSKIQKCRYQDVYHAALVYCLGLSEDTRKHVEQIYDFKTGCVRTECLSKGWQTSGSKKIVRMAYSLYNNGTPSIYDYDNSEDQLRECSLYSAEDLFCCSYAPFFWQAVKIRYPEYCGETA